MKVTNNKYAKKMLAELQKANKDKERKEKQAKTRQVNKYVKLKQDILDLLKRKGFSEAVDLGLVNTVVFNQKLMDRVENDLLNGEYMTNVRKEGDALFQISPLYTVYNTAFKNYVTGLTKLGITPQERSKLGLNKIEETQKDGF